MHQYLIDTQCWYGCIPTKNKQKNNFYLSDPIFTTIKMKHGIFGIFKYFIYHQNEYKNSILFSAHFLIQTSHLLISLALGVGGWGDETKEGWPLLIQRLGICIWLLFVNQWSDRADQGVSPRLSLSLRILTHKTQLRKKRNYTPKSRMYAVTWNHLNSDWSTHEPSARVLPVVFFPSVCNRRGRQRSQTGGKQECFFRFQRVLNGTEADVVSLFFFSFFFSYTSLTSLCNHLFSFTGVPFVFLRLFLCRSSITLRVFLNRCDVIKSPDQWGYC